VIDLRSDTLTKPTEAMRLAMATAEVGDDCYGEDPSINALEARTAELLGHEAGLFCPTGTMSNLLAIWALVDRGKEVLCDERCHLMRAEMGSHAALHGITSRTWAADDGVVVPSRVAQMISPPSQFLLTTGAVAVENSPCYTRALKTIAVM
jgi:threonine aldolase